MCGIVGSVGRVPDQAWRRRALRCIEHRGPDGEGELLTHSVWLGHRRLSIIDLTEEARQPMSRTGLGAISFNGEIYDYDDHRRSLEGEGFAFRTTSDTEVLLAGLARKGPSFTESLHGMWAFAFLDESDGSVLLGRDHAGMKPLYVFEGSGFLAFASELRALREIVRGLGEGVRSSAEAIASVLRFGSVTEPLTFVRGATVVPPDSVWTVAPNGTVTGRRRLRRRQGISASTRFAVETAIGRHLVADVPVSIFLSSGIDSGVIAAAAARAAGSHLTAITVEVESRGTQDEPKIARRLAERLGLRHVAVPLHGWLGRIGAALDAYDQPSIDGINTFLVASAAREAGFKVALSGVGADEVYGGYKHLRRKPKAWKHVLKMFTGQIERSGLGLASLGSIRGRRLACLMEGARRGEPFTRSARRILPETWVRLLVPEAEKTPDPLYPGDVLELERRTYLCDTLLRDTDVMGMANGVEIRAPFLDPGVLQDAARIGHASLLAEDKQPKWPLVESWAGELEMETTTRRKTGFTLRLGDWISGEGAGIVEHAFEKFPRCAAVERAAAESLVRAARREARSSHPAAHVLTLLVVQLQAALERFGEP